MGRLAFAVGAKIGEAMGDRTIYGRADLVRNRVDERARGRAIVLSGDAVRRAAHAGVPGVTLDTAYEARDKYIETVRGLARIALAAYEAGGYPMPKNDGAMEQLLGLLVEPLFSGLAWAELIADIEALGQKAA
jgi:hypothetical protein